MKEKIAELLQEHLPFTSDKLMLLIESPPDPKMGDYAFPCFSLAKELKKSPQEIAQDIVSKIKNTSDFENIEAKGPYVNFFVNRMSLARETIISILKKKNKYGSSTNQSGKKILIEFSSPNIAKPFGIGHLRSTIIGNSLSKIASFQGAKVVRLNYLGDWGTQFGKLIVGYERWGNDKKLKSNPISHLLDIYVKVNADPELEQPARDAFRKLEEGNKKYTALWKKFRALSLKSFNSIYNELGVSFDVVSGESLYNKKKESVLKSLKSKNLLKESQGALIVDLENKGLGICLIQKSDGSTIYATRDIAAAIDRHTKYKFDEMWYEVGSEQRLHFKQVFSLLSMLGYPWAKNCVHIDHGLYLDSDGKKFSTRKGKTVYMEDILKETEQIASDEINKREKLSKSELSKRAHAIALAAIYYGDLKNYRASDMLFDIDRFLSFEGDTGPYLLYSYARAASILRKAKFSAKPSPKLEVPSDSEKELISLLASFTEKASEAFEQKAPHLIAHYAYNISQLFNEWYHQEKIIGSSREEHGLYIVASYAQVLKNSLSLLGIPVLERM